MMSYLRSMFASHSYTIVMAISAVITMVKLIALASYVEAEHFNDYIIPLSLGSFLAFILSLGLVESTTKIFARLFAEKQEIIALGSYRYILPTLLKRGLFLLCIALIYARFFEHKSFFWVLSICLIACTVSASTLLASMQRSTMKTNIMSGTSLLRALLSVTAVFIGYSFSPIYGPIIGEVIAQLLSLIAGFLMLLKSHRLSYREVIAVPMANISRNLAEKHSIKLSLFLAYLIMSIPVYLDRYYFELNYPIGELAPYSLCAILLGVSYLVFNTLYQRAGPRMVIEYKLGSSQADIFRLAAGAAIAGIIFLILFFLFIMAVYGSGYAESLFSKYAVSVNMLLLVFSISIFNSTGIFEGIFLSFDQEKKFMQSSFFYLACLAISLVVNFYYSLTLIEFLLIYLIIKVSHFIFIFLLFYLYLKDSNSHKVVI